MSSKAGANKQSKLTLKNKKPSVVSSLTKIPDCTEKPEIVYEEKTITIEVKEMYITPIAGRPCPTEIKIQVDHLQQMIGESDVITCNTEGSTKINFSVELKVYPTKPGGTDEIVSNPVLLTVLDSSQKQAVKESPKKAPKEVKVSVYGRSNLDLLPIFLGERKFYECLLLEQDKKVIAEEIITWPNLPRLLVSAEVCELMLSSVKRKFQNILHVTVESLHNLLPEMTENINYKAAMAVPSYSEDFQTVYFDNGMYNHSYQPEYFKKWSDFSFLEGRANLSKYSLSQKLGDVKTDKSIDLSTITNEEVPCVEWYALKRFWLSKPGVATIFNTLTRYKCWPIEITGSAKAGATGKSGKSKTKGPEQNFHFIAYLDVSALLYPGETITRVASQLFTFNRECAKERCGLEKSLFDTGEMEVDEGKSTQPKKSDKKSAKSQMIAVEMEEPSEPVFTEDGWPVFIIVEFELLRPLIEKWKKEDILKSLSEAIPPREELPKQAMSAEAAVVHYDHCIKIVSELISSEFQDYCFCNRNAEENLLDDFFIYLQSTEIFGQIVNILRDKVTVLIREKYSPGITFNSNEERQNFISDVYVNLVEEMHSTLHSLLDGGDKASEKTYDVTSDQKYYFAIESAEEGDCEKANQLYLERISSCKKNPDFWLDYALFCIRTGDAAQARECIREALSLDIRHPLGLLLYGILLSTNGDLQEAELFFAAVIYFHPRIVEAWVIFHLYYLSIEKNEGAYITLRRAQKLMTQCGEEMDYLCVSSEPLAWSTPVMKHESVFLLTAKLLLKLHAIQFSELALSEEVSINGTSIAYKYYLSVGHYLSGRYDDAISHLQQIIDEDFKNYLARSLIGHCYYKLGEKKKAAEYYNFVVDAEDRPKNLHLVNIRLGIYYVQVSNFLKAKENFFEACLSSPTPRTWLGYGSACFMVHVTTHTCHESTIQSLFNELALQQQHLRFPCVPKNILQRSSVSKAGDMEEAEKAFTEANMLDPQCPNVWAYLCLINIHLDREEEYSQCYRQLLKNQNIIDDKEELQHFDPI